MLAGPHGWAYPPTKEAYVNSVHQDRAPGCIPSVGICIAFPSLSRGFCQECQIPQLTPPPNTKSSSCIGICFKEKLLPFCLSMANLAKRLNKHAQQWITHNTYHSHQYSTAVKQLQRLHTGAAADHRAQLALLSATCYQCLLIRQKLLSCLGWRAVQQHECRLLSQRLSCGMKLARVHSLATVKVRRHLQRLSCSPPLYRALQQRYAHSEGPKRPSPKETPPTPAQFLIQLLNPATHKPPTNL